MSQLIINLLLKSGRFDGAVVLALFLYLLTGAKATSSLKAKTEV